MFLAILFFAGGGFFLKWKGHFFLFGVLPSKYSGSVAGLQCGLGFAKTIFWGKGFGKTSADFVFAFCPRGGGVWGGIRAGFSDLKFQKFGTAEIKATLNFIIR